MRNRITVCLLSLLWEAILLAAPAIGDSPPAVPVKPGGGPAALADFTLPGGLRCLVLPEPGCAGIHVRVMAHAGAALDPPDRSGLAAVSMELLEAALTSGSRETDSCVRPAGAAVTAGCDSTSVWVGASFPAGSLEQSLPAFLLRLREPALDPERLEAIKNRRRAGLSHSEDDVAGVANREFRRIVYGRNNPYARTADDSGLAGITLEEAADWLDRNFRSDNVVIGIRGDFPADRARSLLVESTAGWSRSDSVHPVFPAVANPPAASVNRLSLPAAGCTLLTAGHLGIRLDHPDWLPLQLMAIILNRRLAATPVFHRRPSGDGSPAPVICSLESPAVYPGLFTVTAGIEPASVAPAVDAIRGELRRLREAPVSGKEIGAARLECVRNFPLPGGSGDSPLSQKLMLAFYGLPLNFVASAKARLVEVGPAEIQRVAGDFLRPGEMTVLVAGPPELLAGALSGLGTVHDVQPAAASPAPETRVAAPAFPPPSTASLARGKMTLDRVPESLALSSRLDNLRGFHLLQRVESPDSPAPSPAASVETWVFLPDRYRETTRRLDSETSLCLDGVAGWRKSSGEPATLDPDDRVDLQGRLARLPLVFLRDSRVEGFRVQRLGTEEIGGKPAETLLIRQEGGPAFEICVNTETGWLAAIRWYGRQGPATGVYLEVFAPPADFGGISYPAGSEIFFNGERISRTRVAAVELDPDLDESLFRR